ncbi:MAG TPA: group I intron-associated PD-(D/E)XK endonuclease [Gaiellaceae bacterium]
MVGYLDNGPGTEHPKIVGDRTQLAVMAALYAAGYGLYVPFGENTRCDLIVERDDGLMRVQCKTGRLRSGTIRFAVCSVYAHHSNPKAIFRTYEGEIDAFAVYCPETSGIYLVPIAEVPNKRGCWLRTEAPRNNQLQRVRWARDYEIGTVAIGGLRAPSGA